MKELWHQCAPWLAALAALLGGLYFLGQAVLQAHAQASVLDEGAYLYKGYLFATGQYKPYQPYGPWTNHMPLSFLIPGYLQLWLGLGLRTARYAAIGLAFIGLLAFWLTARRLAGPWWAAGLVWVVAYNPALVKLYSISASQGLVFCLLGIALALTLGKTRPTWQVTLGAVFAGLLLMTRINMSPVYALLLVYIFWQHGKVAGYWAAGVSLALLLGLHLYYAPGIFEFWGKQLPGFITALVTSLPGVNPPIIPGEIAQKVWDPGQYQGLASRWTSLLLALKVHLAPVIGFLAALMIWRKPVNWRSRSGFKAAVLLAAAFTALFAAHAWAALGKSYCVYCLESYMAFFSPLGLLLIAVFLAEWPPERPLRRWQATLIIAALLALALWFGYHQSWVTVRDLLKSEIARFKDFHIQPGTIPLWGLIENFTGWDYEQSFNIFSWSFGALAAAALLLLNGLLRRRAKPGIRYPAALTLLVLSLALSALAAPSELLAGYDRIYDCRGDVIEAYETVGTQLQQVIPPGAKVYWRGGLSAVPLLYIPAAQPYLPQINSNYSRFIGGDDETMLMLGRWNDTLAEKWLAEADYLLVAGENLAELGPAIDSGTYTLVLTTTPVIDCRQNAPIFVFQRVIQSR